MLLPQQPGPIGVFDSGYGGLTVLKALRSRLPKYDYLYLGDNARAPYGTRSFDVVYRYTRQCVKALFQQDCHLVILACNTASAKALRSIQQKDLPRWDSRRRVLGVIRPTAEIIGSVSKTRHVGILATTGTILSRSYDIEIHKLWPDITVTGLDCPMWVPLVENFEAESPGADYFVQERIRTILGRDPKIDALLLGCTHYPLLLPKIRKYTPRDIAIIAQGEYVAASLEDYLRRHQEMAGNLTCGGSLACLTTEEPEKFNLTAARFLGEPVCAQNIRLE